MIPNIKCDGQKEIDLFAIDPTSGDRYHIETTVSISQAFRALTLREFASGDHKVRGKAARARRTLGFFLEEKFDAPGVKATLSRLGGGAACRRPRAAPRISRTVSFSHPLWPSRT